MYQVESIVGKRINPLSGVLEYQVRWCNYAKADATWVPQKNLMFVKKLINQFNGKNQIHEDLLKATARASNKHKQKEHKNIKNNHVNINNKELQSKENNSKHLQEYPQQVEKLNRQIKPKTSVRQNKSIDEQQIQGWQLSNQSKQEQQKIAKKQQKFKNINNDRQIDQMYQQFLKAKQQKRKNNPKIISMNSNKNIFQLKPNYALQQTNKPANNTSILDNRANEISDAFDYRYDNDVDNDDDGVQSASDQANNINYFSNTNVLPRNRIIPPPPLIRLGPPDPPLPILTHSKGCPRGMAQQQYNYRGNSCHYYKEGYFKSQQKYDQSYNNLGKINVTKVMSMEKIGQDFVYLVDSNQGQMWLTREQILPQFAMALVQFYQRYLTFNE